MRARLYNRLFEPWRGGVDPEEAPIRAPVGQTAEPPGVPAVEGQVTEPHIETAAPPVRQRVFRQPQVVATVTMMHEPEDNAAPPIRRRRSSSIAADVSTGTTSGDKPKDSQS